MIACCLAHSVQLVTSNLPNEVSVIEARLHASSSNSYSVRQVWRWIQECSQQIEQAWLQNETQEQKIDPENAASKSDEQGGSFSIRRVGVMIPPSAEYIVAIVSVNKASAAFVPLEWSWPVERIVAVAQHSGISLLLACHQTPWIPQGYEQAFSRVSQALSCPQLRVPGFNFSENKPEKSSQWSCQPSPFSYIIYTSGSTGKPKGVCGTQEGLLNRLNWMQHAYPYDSSDVSCFKTSVSFIDHLTELLGPLLAGTKLIIPFAEDIKSNPLGLLKYLEVYKVTRLVAVPSLLRAILPAIQSASALKHLRVLVSSGESLPWSLAAELRKALKKTTILNLYGSTEVSGDIAFFECSKASELTGSVPIGKPITGCFMEIFSETGACAEDEAGELYVGGAGLATGYWSDASTSAQRFLELGGKKFFKTGDLARRLESGEFVVLGRIGRLLQLHGQRVEPEEVEWNLEDHHDVEKAVVFPLQISSSINDVKLAACVALKIKNSEVSSETKAGVLKRSLENKLPSYMVPEHFIFVDKLPLTSSGKVVYSAVHSLKLPGTQAQNSVPIQNSVAVEKILKVFSTVLHYTESLSPSDDFFLLGGTSVTAAHAAHLLGIDVRLLYKSRSALALHDAIASLHDQEVDNRGLQEDFTSETRRFQELPCSCNTRKKLKLEAESRSEWLFPFTVSETSAFVRGNRDLHSRGLLPEMRVESETWLLRVAWKQCLHACVDASPLLMVSPGFEHRRLYVGSHSHQFFCIDASSGEVLWETTLGGRVESTAAVTRDFSQIVAGCYDGCVYFLDPSNGIVLWSYQTGAEVKCQPAVDTTTGFIWCGSHDHNLYILDPVSRACIWKLSCDGSIFGSPALDFERKQAYVATTSGRFYSIHTLPSYGVSWEHTADAPVFSSPCFIPSSGHVLLASVSGSVTALSGNGQVLWKVSTGGPIFSPLCASRAINDQVLVCSRDGFLYSYSQVTGKLVWKINLEEPLVAGAWIDESLQLNDSSRLVCACSTSGRVYLVKTPALDSSRCGDLEVVCHLQLPGDVFSTPMMIGGRIFVGCRDNHLYCLDFNQPVVYTLTDNPSLIRCSRALLFAGENLDCHHFSHMD